MLNNRGRTALIVVAALICIVIGFVIGQVVQAMNTLPGDSDDPVATQSYVETTVGERLAVLTTRIDELEAEVAALKGGGSSTTTTGNDDGGESTTAEEQNVEITGNSVNVRDEASTSGSIIASLSRGTVVTLVSDEGDWYQVRLSNGQTGYVSADYAEIQ